MIQFIEALGWVFVGICGCRENKRMYVNSDFPTWQVWVTPNNSTLQMRKKYTQSADTTLKGIGGVANYQQVYNYWITQ